MQPKFLPLLTAIVIICSGSSADKIIRVSNVTELQRAMHEANNSGGQTTILVADGTYSLDDTLYVNAPGITLAGESGRRENVVLQGDAMSDSARVRNLIRVAAPDFELTALTLRRSGWHLIQIAGESDADSPKLTNCILQDAYQQMVKVSVDTSDLDTTSDGGLIENCVFEYTAEEGPQHYIGGLDAHGAKNWVVRNNEFRNIASPDTSVAQYAIHFWNQSADNLVEKNRIVNCDRGIGFGLGERGNSGGIIRNNMIYHAPNHGSFADVGIALQNSPDSAVYNNTIFMEHSYRNAIEIRFAGTVRVAIINNLSNRGLAQLDGAVGEEAANIVTAQRNWFVDPAAGDLHLARRVISVENRGQSISGLFEDIDGDARPRGSGIDIGADEY